MVSIDLKTYERKHLVPTEAHWKKIKDAFIPLTEDQSIDKLLQVVRAYEALQHALHGLPDFYFRSIGSQAQFNPTTLPEIKFADAGMRDECARVQQSIVSLLSRYEDSATSASPAKPPAADP